jgi:hypothetical protein
VQAGLRSPQHALRLPRSFVNAGRVPLKTHESTSAYRYQGTLFEALKRPAVIVQQYRDRFQRSLALSMRMHDPSRLPNRPTPQSLRRTLELMKMEKI